jgi:hypothetical protein
VRARRVLRVATEVAELPTETLVDPLERFCGEDIAYISWLVRRPLLGNRRGGDGAWRPVLVQIEAVREAGGAL